MKRLLLGDGIQKTLKKSKGNGNEKVCEMRKMGSGLSVDTKEVKRRTELELRMLTGRVSPNKMVQPSLIKKRVAGRKERQQVHAAILKHAHVKELKQRVAK